MIKPYFFPIDRQFHCSLTHLFFSSIFLNLINIDTVSQSSLQLHMETTINHQSVDSTKRELASPFPFLIIKP
ncbi:hypothetical protein HanRHA438_Chr01g0016861 [Helianthus annuus]|uniref:Uncharacterized protein n=1 Tax=Helianthus annuus TaxID=4232 RepID=A0A251VMH8_HELAN|nr:hypothetical protein HanXRQr2_Chr01g0016501 [Helianthus annuus]KAJ0611294.1 hypothetical protein HanHA300_Chr01g0013611 [Helianthus annuus]KAJ0622283.1 hypothetical protein HanIR_Chr01g0018251 [Helianthus annuus]KAJ0626569.1 hypothetical protein HanHA89_Chr01g0014671 [Helianthus annuus]KAJ0947587.1 hypothetical protein HanRHA438_Chr01g0016861 [Helianthus annuus]